MKRLWMGCLALAMGLAAHDVQAQVGQWRPVSADASRSSDIGVRLRPPEPLPTVIQSADFSPNDASASRVVRAQGLDPTPFTPPAPPPPPPVPVVSPGNAPSDERYNCAVKANSSGGSFWDQTREGIVGIPAAVGGVFDGASSRSLFQSDHCFDTFCSPVTNPFFFEDPRALTEIRPLVMFQRIPGSNYAFQGGDVWFYGVQGRLAVTDMFTVVINKLGAVTFSPSNTSHGSGTGFAELSLGPKFTFYRNESSRTVMAAGLDFDLGIGSSNAFQNTGDLSLIPYFSIAQQIAETSYGRFNFMNSTGYSFATDSQRTDFLYSSFHFDYDVMNLNKFFPLIELNYFHYSTNGHANPLFGFEGRDLINFGAGGVAGQNDLSIAAGLRYKFAEWLQVGLAAEFPLLQKDLMNYRIGFDLIFRY